MKKEKLNFRLMSNSISEKKKGVLPNLLRIRDESIDKINSFDDIKKHSYELNFNISYRQKIMTKKYFKKYIDLKGKDKLESYVPLLLKFIRTFHPQFPYPEAIKSLQTCIEKINNLNLNNIYNETTKTFYHNKCSNVGVEYLKSNFYSY